MEEKPPINQVQINGEANFGSQLQKAYYLIEKGEMQEAEDILKELLLDKDTRPAAFYGLGVIEFSREEYDKAQDYFSQTTLLNPNHAHAYFYLGVISEHQEVIQKAENYYQKALSIDVELQQFTGGFFRQLLFFVGSRFQIGMVSDNPVQNVSFFCYTSPRYTQKQPVGLFS